MAARGAEESGRSASRPVVRPAFGTWLAGDYACFVDERFNAQVNEL